MGGKSNLIEGGGEYFKRELFEEIIKWIDRREIIAIKGPRQSGKTTLLEMLEKWLKKEKKIKGENIIYLSFEDRELLSGFSLDTISFIERYINGEKSYFLIDEAHYCKDLGQKLKLIYDKFKNVKIIITGSSSLELTSETAKYLVGRVFSFELPPLNFHEFLLTKDEKLAKIYKERNEKLKNFIYKSKNFGIKKNFIDIHIKELFRHFEEYAIYGGYPAVIKAEKLEEKNIILKNIYNTYVEKDIINYLQITDIAKFRKFVSILSYTIGDVASYESMANEANSYFKEVLNLLDILQQTYIIKCLKPFSKNLVTELRKNPKFYFFDLGLRNYAINNFNKLEIRADKGKLAENFTLNQVFYSKSDDFNVNFWRTTAKAEVDIILSNVKEEIPVEIKFENIKKEGISRSFHSFIDNYEPKRGLIATKDYFGEMKAGNTKILFIPICYF